MSTPRLLILTLSNQSKDSSQLYKYTSELVAHGSAFKQYLWENNSINVSESELIQLTLEKEKDSIEELRNVIRIMMKENRTEATLENCLMKVLELRELLMFQIEERGIQFVKYNPLLEIEKALLEQLNIYGIYQEFYAKNSEKFQQRKNTIKTKFTMDQIYSYLKISGSNNLIDEDGDFIYEIAIEELNKFVSDPYPHLFLERVQWIYNNF